MAVLCKRYSPYLSPFLYIYINMSLRFSIRSMCVSMRNQFCTIRISAYPRTPALTQYTLWKRAKPVSAVSSPTDNIEKYAIHSSRAY